MMDVLESCACAVGSESVGVFVLCSSLVHCISFSIYPLSAGEVYLLCLSVSECCCEWKVSTKNYPDQ